MNVAFCSSEIAPFAKTGGMADVCYSLPVALEKLGVRLTLFMPEYRQVREVSLPIERMDSQLSRSVIGKNIEVYFIRNDAFFKRDSLYGDAYGDYGDNLPRFHYFCSRSLDVMKAMNHQADVIHCHDWQTSLIPAYIRYQLREDPFWARKKTVLTIHNLAYQGVFPPDQFGRLGFDKELFHHDLFEFYGQVNLLKVGILTSDRLTTVSPQYAREIRTPQYGCSLDGVLNSRREDLSGILNGIDVATWNPGTDPLIPQSYSAKTIDRKKMNKAALQAQSGLAARDNVPLFGFVGRLSHQKGIDLLIQSMYKIEKMDVQLVILGAGEKRYEDLLVNLAGRYPDKIAFYGTFDEKLAHQIYAGSDLFLMPSLYEPCGLSQMISLRYGTIPVVFRTGGLADTICSYKEGGNGFVFTRYDREAFIRIFQEAVQVYHDTEVFAELVRKAFTHDFSWESSAKKYLEVYEQLRAGGTRGRTS